VNFHHDLSDNVHSCILTTFFPKYFLSVPIFTEVVYLSARYIFCQGVDGFLALRFLLFYIIKECFHFMNIFIHIFHRIFKDNPFKCHNLNEDENQKLTFLPCRNDPQRCSDRMTHVSPLSQNA
jgi:hypothetical protein